MNAPIVPAHLRHDTMDINYLYNANTAYATLNYALKHPEEIARSLVSMQQLIMEAMKANEEAGKALQRIGERHK